MINDKGECQGRFASLALIGYFTLALVDRSHTAAIPIPPQADSAQLN
jgi:hypothetical protein